MDLSVRDRRNYANLGGAAITIYDPRFFKGKVWLQLRLQSGGAIASLEPQVPTVLRSKNIAETP